MRRESEQRSNLWLIPINGLDKIAQRRAGARRSRGHFASPRVHFLNQMSEINSDTGIFHFPRLCEDSGRVTADI